ncbi:aldo/keto reductase [Allofustis seminis]|uniref:aldo/keto reductase n=1 Tax=Allofustis seminis TaxID=166939 RepID=UPI000370F1C9|nr:aldo/keto reductase [Allofustis seminis]
MNKNSRYTLNDGHQIPVIGFGTWQMPNDESTTKIIEEAIHVGYRHIDTAAIYGNEEAVGQAIKNSPVKREDLFITTKLWNTEHTYAKAKQAIDTSLEKLQLDTIDLYLIHWPNPIDYRENWQEANAQAWKAMEEAVQAGKIKSIGVSNFMPHHLTALLETAQQKPVVNQIYLNPSDAQPEVVKYSQSLDILLEAYSPLGTGEIFKINELQSLAEKYNKSVAQMALRWSLQKGFLPLPKTHTLSRVAENIDVFDFEISMEDMKQMDRLKDQAGQAINPDETTF